MPPQGLLLQSTHLFELNTTPGVAPGTFARLAEGLNNFEPNTNEEVAQDTYLDGKGFASSTVTGAQLILTFTGHRKFGNPAQDYIFSKLTKLGSERETDFRWTLPDGSKFEGACTIANIEGPSGDANAKGEISFEIHFNGEPTFTPAAADGTPPTVTTNPIDGATGFAVGSNIVWTFSEAIQSSLVTDANFFVTKADGTPVAGTLALSAGNTVVTFDPTANLTAATDYIAVATRNVKDVAGNALAANSITNFRTV
ncbi:MULTISPECIES: phage tail tube protein [Ectobacillus]|jgi:hypothetical protein|uniref:phage tail tube protein n=1 Tax=Ectobacillus TaxID=2837502 RepID=UPI0013DDF5D3|nr:MULTISPECIES: Ig-like domain-containing protein [Ectobacillus]UOY92899.1 Ig-like domain-containing protein [Ectobacillus sp. JY-23]